MSYDEIKRQQMIRKIDNLLRRGVRSVAFPEEEREQMEELQEEFQKRGWKVNVLKECAVFEEPQDRQLLKG